MLRIVRLSVPAWLIAVLVPALVAEPLADWFPRGAAKVLLAAQADPPLRFETDVRPILKAHCWQCHGEAGVVKGGLDLRQVRGIVRGGESGPGLVAFQPAESLLLERVVAGDMPPGEKKLGAREVGTLRAWIEQGRSPPGRSRMNSPQRRPSLKKNETSGLFGR